jgi:hypothetical protein
VAASFLSSFREKLFRLKKFVVGLILRKKAVFVLNLSKFLKVKIENIRWILLAKPVTKLILIDLFGLSKFLNISQMRHLQYNYINS